MDATAFRIALNGWDDGRGALYRRLARSIEAQIDEGVFRRGMQLPAERFCQHAADCGVVLASCKNFSLCAGVRHVRIPFTAEPDVIREGLRRAGAAWRTFRS